MKNNSKLWEFLEDAPGDFLEKLNYPKVISQLLYHRGVKNKEEAEKFFEPDYEKDLLDPFLALGMKHALKRVIKAIKNKEKIVLYHDYDADGVCGAVVVASTLKELGVSFDTYTPDRQKEGYGLNKNAIEKILKDKPDLLITIDCGISDVSEIDLLNERAVDVIIIDHHLPGDILPNAYAIINPKQKECNYAFKDMCAAGVAFKFCLALLQSEVGEKRGIKKGFEKWLLDLVAIATVADMMPLLGENRVLVKYGLLVIGKTKRPGLKRLVDAVSYQKLNSKSIAFGIAPKINATSRMEHAFTSYSLLFTSSDDEADKLFSIVESLNSERRSYVEKIVKDAIFWIEKDIEKNSCVPDVILIGSDEWTPGVVGLVAGKITEKYNKPAFVYGAVGNILKGSCRGVCGINIVDVMKECNLKKKGVLDHFGGHISAGGFSLKKENLSDFRGVLFEIVKEKKNKIPKEVVLKVDAKINADDVNWEVFNFISRFEPFGQANQVPIFAIFNLELFEKRLVGKEEKHIKLKLKAVLNDGKIKFFDAIGFSLAYFYGEFEKGDKVDIVFTMEENEWQGRKDIQLKIIDIKKSNI